MKTSTLLFCKWLIGSAIVPVCFASDVVLYIRFRIISVTFTVAIKPLVFCLKLFKKCICTLQEVLYLHYQGCSSGCVSVFQIILMICNIYYATLFPYIHCGWGMHEVLREFCLDRRMLQSCLYLFTLIAGWSSAEIYRNDKFQYQTNTSLIQ